MQAEQTEQHKTPGPVTIPTSGIIPTRNRAEILRRTLASLAEQSHQPAEIIVVDASTDDATAKVCAEPPALLASEVRYFRAEILGAAAQRNQAVRQARQQIIHFLDDDIILEPDCIRRQYAALTGDAGLGGVSAMITNQKYSPPGWATRQLLRILRKGKPLQNYAGKVAGPGVHLLPEDSESLPEVVEVEWLNTTCTMYRKSALPEPPFPPNFTGYSLSEDFALSQVVRKSHRLANARTARFFHDSQSGDHKANRAALAEMAVVNTHFCMREVMGLRGSADYCRLALVHLFSLAALLRSPHTWPQIPAVVRGQLRGAQRILGELQAHCDNKRTGAPHSRTYLNAR